MSQPEADNLVPRDADTRDEAATVETDIQTQGAGRGRPGGVTVPRFRAETLADSRHRDEHGAGDDSDDRDDDSDDHDDGNGVGVGRRRILGTRFTGVRLLAGVVDVQPEETLQKQRAKESAADEPAGGAAHRDGLPEEKRGVRDQEPEHGGRVDHRGERGRLAAGEPGRRVERQRDVVQRVRTVGSGGLEQREHRRVPIHARRRLHLDDTAQLHETLGLPLGGRVRDLREGQPDGGHAGALLQELRGGGVRRRRPGDQDRPGGFARPERSGGLAAERRHLLGQVHSHRVVRSSADDTRRSSHAQDRRQGEGEGVGDGAQVQVGLGEPSERRRGDWHHQQRQGRVGGLSAAERLDRLRDRDGASPLLSPLGLVQLVPPAADIRPAFQVQVLRELQPLRELFLHETVPSSRVQSDRGARFGGGVRRQAGKVPQARLHGVVVVDRRLVQVHTNVERVVARELGHPAGRRVWPLLAELRLPGQALDPHGDAAGHTGALAEDHGEPAGQQLHAVAGGGERRRVVQRSGRVGDDQRAAHRHQRASAPGQQGVLPVHRDCDQAVPERRDRLQDTGAADHRQEEDVRESVDHVGVVPRLGLGDRPGADEHAGAARSRHRATAAALGRLRVGAERQGSARRAEGIQDQATGLQRGSLQVETGSHRRRQQDVVRGQPRGETVRLRRGDERSAGPRRRQQRLRAETHSILEPVRDQKGGRALWREARAGPHPGRQGVLVGRG